MVYLSYLELGDTVTVYLVGVDRYQNTRYMYLCHNTDYTKIF